MVNPKFYLSSLFSGNFLYHLLKFKNEKNKILELKHKHLKLYFVKTKHKNQIM